MSSEQKLARTIPKHIAIVMDGNGRWAQKRFMPRMFGHHRGVEAVRKVVDFCLQNSIEVLTLFAFSSENWKRSKTEVTNLMGLLYKLINEEVEKLHANNIKLSIVGEIEKLVPDLQRVIAAAQERTKTNTKLKLNVAINYGGRWDITNAMRKIALDVTTGKIEAAAINEGLVNQYMALSDMPEVDLFMRTSGEQRISNFLLWQLAYTEIYFTDVLWPDVDAETMTAALQWYSSRERRFGDSVGLFAVNSLATGNA